MSELLNLFPIGLFLVLLWNIRRVVFNKDYLALSTTKYFKGWFALVIILHHLSQLTNGGFLFRPFTTVGYLAVAVFFFFSGFGSQKHYMMVPKYASVFLGRRLPAIFVPYLVASVCYMVIQNIYGKNVDAYRIFFPWEHGKTLLPHAWFIFAIATFYVVFYGFMKICKRNYKAVFAGVVAYCLLCTYFCLTFQYGPWWILSAAALPFGIFCAWKENLLTHLLQKQYLCVLLTTVVIGIYLILLYPWAKDHFPHYILGNVNSVLCVIVLLLVSAKFQIGNRILAFLGNIYLEIYLMQGIFMSTVPMRRFRVFLSNDFLWCLTVLMGTIFGGYVLHQICQKPLQMYQRKKKLIIQ